MPSASSCSAARTTSSTLRLWPRCTTSAPCAWISRRMMLIAASWPSNRLAAVTKRSGVASVAGAAARMDFVDVLMASSQELARRQLYAEMLSPKRLLLLSNLEGHDHPHVGMDRRVGARFGMH